MIGETVTIIRRGAPTGGEDSQGNPVFAADTEIESDGWAVSPRATGSAFSRDTTAESFGQVTVAGLTLYRREEVTVHSTDKFFVRGTAWVVDGDLGDWVNPYAAEFVGMVVNLKRQGS